MAAYDVPTHRQRTCDVCGAVRYEKAHLVKQPTGISIWEFDPSGFTGVTVNVRDQPYLRMWEKVLCPDCACRFISGVNALLRKVDREEAKKPDET